MPVLPSDSTEPSVLPIFINTGLFYEKPLDKTSNNWPDWSCHVEAILGLSQGPAEGYIDGSIKQPNAETEPRAHRNWLINDKAVRSFLILKSTRAERPFIESAKTAKEAWDALKARHEQAGPVKQALLIQEALGIRYSRTEPFSATSSKLNELNTRIWAMGTPSEELFLCILMMNAMNGVAELDTTLKCATRDLAKSQIDSSDGKPRYRPSDISIALDAAHRFYTMWQSG